MKKYTDQTIWGRGIHKGKALANIPDDWFKFMWDSMQAGSFKKDHLLMDYIKENAQALKIKL